MKKKYSKTEKIERKVLGVTANLRNMMIAVALLFAFIGGFFQIYSWIDTTYAKAKWVKQIELKQDYERENTVLNGLYSRFCFLDQIVTLAIDPTKVDAELRKEWLELKSGKIERQKEKVKLLEEELQRSKR